MILGFWVTFGILKKTFSTHYVAWYSVTQGATTLT